MVVKDLDPVQASHAYEQAGVLALEQMGYYLKQAFGKEAEKTRSPNTYGVRIFNGLRFEMDHYAVQFDHLILHRYGFILIENRSEAADIEVNIWGEWKQHFMGVDLKISSPVNQGERKLRFLQAFLERNSDKLRSKRKNGVQKRFEALGFDFVVAIHNQHRFTAPAGAPIPEACRAALVPERIFHCMEAHRRQAHPPFGLSTESDASLSDEDIFKLSAFFRNHHKPLDRERLRLALSTDHASRLKPARHYYRCEVCGGKQLSMEHQLGYHLSCQDCASVMDIDRTCPHCNRKTYIRREGPEYYLECEACLHSEVIFVHRP